MHEGAALQSARIGRLCTYLLTSCTAHRKRARLNSCVVRSGWGMSLRLWVMGYNLDVDVVVVDFYRKFWYAVTTWKVEAPSSSSEHGYEEEGGWEG